MMLPHNATVAVVDGETLNLFQNGGDEGALALKAVESPALDIGNAGSGGRHRSSAANPDDSPESHALHEVFHLGPVEGAAPARQKS